MKEQSRRKLSLNRETVRELQDSALDEVKGAAISYGCWTPVIWTLPVNQCIRLEISRAVVC